MEVDFDIVLTAIVVCALIIQTTYVAKQTKFFIRSSQVGAIDKWFAKLTSITANRGLSARKNRYVLPWQQLNKLVETLSQMHPLFRERVLKPSDFAIFFRMLFETITKGEDLRKTETYRENYLQLQIIFDDFNRDVDAMMNVYDIRTPSIYEQISGKMHGRLQKKIASYALRNWAGIQLGLRLWLWFEIKVRGKRFFKLPEPVEGGGDA